MRQSWNRGPKLFLLRAGTRVSEHSYCGVAGTAYVQTTTIAVSTVPNTHNTQSHITGEV